MNSQPERFVITGGTGFIGRALAQRLLDRGADVSILTRSRERVAKLFETKVRGIESFDELGPHETPEVIVNLAGMNLAEKRWNDNVRQAMLRSRLDVTRQVIDYIKHTATAPALLISASAIGYYGARGDEIIDDSAGPADEYQSDLCAQWERAAAQAGALGVRTCIARLGVVIGPGGGALAEALPIFRLGLGAVIGNGRQWFSWIALADVLRIFDDFIVDKSLEGTFNMTAPNPVTNREFVKTLGRVLHRPVLMRIPAPIYRLLFGEVAHLHLTGQRVLPNRHIARGYQFLFPTLEAAISDALRR
jgi:uncharacterized protein (TIGR01777 family)